MKHLLSGLLCALLLTVSPWAAALRVDAVDVALVADRDAAVPGASLGIGLRVLHDPHWHTYWRHPGDSGLATTLSLSLPEGWVAGDIVWPAPKRLDLGPLSSYGYEGDLLLPLQVRVPRTVREGRVEIGGRARWLMCREVCVPGEAELSLSLPVRGQSVRSAHADLFDRALRDAPRQRVTLNLSPTPDGAALGFARPRASAAEFFPYREGLVRAQAPQTLVRIAEGQAARWRLELQSADGVGAGWFDGPAGVLVVDGEAIEVDVRRASPDTARGDVVATAVGAPAGGQAGLAASGSGAARPLRALLTDPPDVAAGTVDPDRPAGGIAGLALALLSGLLGGLLLNLMPCVFPVIGLKVLGFAAHANGDRRQARLGALAFGVGVLSSFWLLAALLLLLRAAGEAVGWGFQLQSPVFIAALALLFVAMGLNFAGVFEIGIGFTRLGNADPLARGKGGVWGAFGSGALAVLVATPCSAPFMGSALGFTLGRPAFEVMLVMTAIAVGMASPYVLVGLQPRLLRWLPKPGRWMESFRQCLAFPMFATVAWLLWVLGLQAGIDAVFALSSGAVLLGLSAWLYGRFVQSPAATHRRLAGALALLALGAALLLALPRQLPAPGADGRSSSREPSVDWVAWSEDKVARAQAQGQPVFVDFTAAWCVSCQVNKKMVLERDEVVEAMRARGMLRLRADWTRQDPAITAALASHGRNGVPLYLVYLPGEAVPRRLPEILTVDQVLVALGPAR